MQGEWFLVIPSDDYSLQKNASVVSKVQGETREVQVNMALMPGVVMTLVLVWSRIAGPNVTWLGDGSKSSAMTLSFLVLAVAANWIATCVSDDRLLQSVRSVLPLVSAQGCPYQYHLVTPLPRSVAEFLPP